MLEVAASAAVILTLFGAGWRFAARRRFWDRHVVLGELVAESITAPELVDYTVYPDDVGGLA